MDYFSTTIKDVGKVVSVGYELVCIGLYDNELIKSLGVDVLKYVDEVYIVIDDEIHHVETKEYRIAHICVKEDLGMERIYGIRDSLEVDKYERYTMHKHAKIREIYSHTGMAYVVHK